MLALLCTAAQALPTFRITQEGVADANANGLVDCGEQFTLQILLFDDAPVISPITPAQGTITVPTQTFATAWRYVPGSLELDSGLTQNCSIASVLSGNAPADDRASFTYSCFPTTNPGGHSYVLAARIRGTYIGTVGPYYVTGEDRLLSGEILTSDLTGSDVQGCPLADLTLAKTDGGISVRPGQTVAYTLSFANNGDPASNVALRETVPANTVANLAVSSPGWACSPSLAAGSACVLPIGNLAAGAAASRTFAADVLPDAVAPAIANTATVSTDTPETTTANNSASDSTPLDPGEPDLELRKTVSSASASPGSTVVFTIDVRNAGTGLAASSVVHDTVPGGATFDPAASSPGWSCSGSDCSFPLGTFVAGATRTLAFAVRLPSPVPFNLIRLDNTACVTTPTPEPTANNCGSATAPVDAHPDLSIAKTLQSGQAVPGATLVFNLTVRNSGDRDSSTVTLTETVPDFTTAAASPGWSCSPGLGAGSTCTALLTSIPGAGGSAQKTFAVIVNSPLPQGADVIHNNACATSPDTPQDCDSIDVPTDARPMVMLAKELTSGVPVPGATLVYTLTAQNTGNRASPAITLTETIPAHTTFDASASSPDWACPSTVPSTVCTLPLGSLDGAGDSAARLFAVRVANPLPAKPGPIANTACAEEPSSPPHCDQVTLTPQGDPVLSLRKVVASGSAEPGGQLTYSITVTNSGNQGAADVVITDSLPPFTTFEPGENSPWTCDAAQCTLTLPSLPAGAVSTLQLTLRLQPNLPAGPQSIRNTACASDGPLRNACDSVDTPLGGSPRLNLTKTYTGPPLRPGAYLPFTLTLQNSGSRDAANVVLRETVPASSTFQPLGSDARWSCQAPTAGSSCELNLDTVAAGASIAVQFVLRADSPLPEGLRQIANSACVLTDDGASSCDEVSTPSPTRVELTLGDLIADDHNGNGTLEDGEIVHYTLTVLNPAPEAAVNLVVTTHLDRHLALVVGSVTTSAGSILSGNDAAAAAPSVSIPRLSPGDSVVIEFDARAIDVLAAGVQEVATQAEAAGPAIETEPSDDPATTDVDDDPTRTPVGSLETPIHEVPTLGQLGLALLSVLLATAGALFLRRPKAV